jgi:hypothetical protein
VRFIKKAMLMIAQLNQFMMWHAPISITALIGLYFNFVLFDSPLESTMSITNSAFGIVAVLSSLSFGYCRSIEDKETKQAVMYCGERFFHSAILFLVASIIKYFLSQDQIKPLLANSRTIGVALFVVSLFPGILYFGSLVNGIAALREINSILYGKKKRGQELKRFI